MDPGDFVCVSTRGKSGIGILPMLHGLEVHATRKAPPTRNSRTLNKANELVRATQCQEEAGSYRPALHSTAVSPAVRPSLVAVTWIVPPAPGFVRRISMALP